MADSHYFSPSLLRPPPGRAPARAFRAPHPGVRGATLPPRRTRAPRAAPAGDPTRPPLLSGTRRFRLQGGGSSPAPPPRVPWESRRSLRPLRPGGARSRVPSRSPRRPRPAAAPGTAPPRAARTARGPAASRARRQHHGQRPARGPPALGALRRGSAGPRAMPAAWRGAPAPWRCSSACSGCAQVTAATASAVPGPGPEVDGRQSAGRPGETQRGTERPGQRCWRGCGQRREGGRGSPQAFWAAGRPSAAQVPFDFLWKRYLKTSGWFRTLPCFPILARPPPGS